MMTTASSPEGARVGDYADAGGTRTYFEAVGSGDPLVLLHGGLCTIETFGEMSSRLAGAYRLYLPERRGHGRTPDVDGPITYELMAGDTIAFLEAVDVPSAHLVGWSDGAAVALLVALRRPDLVRALVLIGQYVNRDGAVPEAAEMMRLDTMPDLLPPIMREMYAGVSPDGPEHWPVVVDKVWQMIRTEPNIALDRLATVSAPTLIIVADRDMVTVEHAEAMRQAMRDTQLVVVPNATHALPMEHPDVVADLVLDFLTTVADGPR